MFCDVEAHWLKLKKRNGREESTVVEGVDIEGVESDSNLEVQSQIGNLQALEMPRDTPNFSGALWTPHGRSRCSAKLQCRKFVIFHWIAKDLLFESESLISNTIC